MNRRFAALAATSLALATVFTASVSVPAHAADVATGTYYTVDSTRILDTRSGLGAPAAKVPAQGSVNLQVGGVAGVPATGVSAVVLNLTGVSPTVATWITAYPSGTVKPVVSSLNLAAFRTRANLITVPVSADGKVTLTNQAGSVHMLADVMGFYAGTDIQAEQGGIGSMYSPIDAERWFDSRFDDGGALGPNEDVEMTADVSEFAANEDVKAIAVNITAIAPNASGYLTAWDGQGEPGSSSVNFVKGQTVPNMAVVPTALVDGLPTFVVRNGPGASTHVAVDVVGYYLTNQADGLRFHSLTPRRMVDTRTGLGTAMAKIGAKATRTIVPPADIASVDDSTVVLVGNTTAIQPTTSTYLTVWDVGFDLPPVSNVNAAAGEIVANSTYILLGYDFETEVFGYNVYNQAGSVNIAIDVVGGFDYYEVPVDVTAQKMPSSSRKTPVGVDAKVTTERF